MQPEFDTEPPFIPDQETETDVDYDDYPWDEITEENKVKILFYDTETTGLPKDYKAPPSDTDNWPRLVQIAWAQLDDKTGQQTEHDYIIKPEGFTIPAESSDIHGITTEIAMEKGLNLRDVISIIQKRIVEADLIVGHNISFDRKILGAEFIRCGIEDVMHGKSRLCTMEASTNYCELPGMYGYKWPKLQELHEKLFGHEFSGAHNALADIQATVRCFLELRKLQIIEEDLLCLF